MAYMCTVNRDNGQYNMVRTCRLTAVSPIIICLENYVLFFDLVNIYIYYLHSNNKYTTYMRIV